LNQQQYLYPQNLKSEAGMWLWSMRDFTVVAVCVLLAVLVLATTRSPIPLAVAAVYLRQGLHSSLILPKANYNVFWRIDLGVAYEKYRLFFS